MFLVALTAMTALALTPTKVLPERKSTIQEARATRPISPTPPATRFETATSERGTLISTDYHLVLSLDTEKTGTSIQVCALTLTRPENDGTAKVGAVTVSIVTGDDVDRGVIDASEAAAVSASLDKLLDVAQHELYHRHELLVTKLISRDGTIFSIEQSASSNIGPADQACFLTVDGHRQSITLDNLRDIQKAIGEASNYLRDADAS